MILRAILIHVLGTVLSTFVNGQVQILRQLYEVMTNFLT